MPFKAYQYNFLIALTVFALFGMSVSFGLAQNNTSDEVQVLNDEIDQKRQNIQQINRQIKEYEAKITKKQQEKASLSVELELIENRIAKTELEIEETNAETDLVNKELFVIERALKTLEAKLVQNKEFVMAVLQEMQVSDHSLPLQIFFGVKSFSELFDSMDQLETVNQDLQNAIIQIKQTKADQESKKTAQLAKHDQLEQLQRNLNQEMNVLQASVGAQESLIAQTQRSESEFRALLSELKQEQQFIDQQIAVLQSEIEGKLSASDDIGDSSALSWPFTPERGISTYFHDSTYPFRHLFEHSGLDLPARTGTPVKAVAPGYVAWARKGRLYGNYIMIIHANGIATLYAHLSKINVEADQFVTRGQVIGAVGNTGLSTGPHLHLEVRKNGVPTDPMDYLVQQ